MKKFLPIFIILLVISFFFKDFLFRGFIPLPADTIVGLYHPWRDYYTANYPNGVPFKNSLITDPVRQQYPWKFLAIKELKQGKLPVWNPYSFSGSPLLANFQSGVFYPLNIIFFLVPFNTGWGIYIYLQFLLGGLFMYLYLNNLRLNKLSSLFGSIVFSFSGVFIAWGWWGNIIHTLIWLPLILFSIDKLIHYLSLNSNIINRKSFYWSFIFIFSLCSSLFAGHLQVFFYVLLMTVTYVIAKTIQTNNNLKTFLLFGLCFLIFGLISSVQWIPTLHFINQSARNLDQVEWQKPGWFIPWQNLLQFIAPDFFGNPATGNYWGTWNYGEFIGYIGILPLILAVFALVFRRDKKVLFFGSLFFLTLLFSLPTLFAKLPYLLKIPLISTSQPTRLLLITDFILTILSALGMDYLFGKGQVKNLSKILISILIVFLFLWLFVLLAHYWLTDNIWQGNLTIAKRNLVLPSIIFIVSSLLLIVYDFLKNKKTKYLILITLFLILVFDLIRFGWKFLPFVKEEYVYPQTKLISFLQNKQQEGRFRIMATDERIFPPNFSIVYQIESVDGYDPLFLKSYTALINKMEDRGANSSFNRIITPKKYESPIADLLNVRYVLSLSDLKSPKLKKVFQEGQTQVYENLSFIKEPYYQAPYEY